jgi:acyl carrier protein
MSTKPEAAPPDVEEKVLSLLAAIKRIPRESVRLDSSFEELGIDSLDATTLLFELESAFDISIPDEQARSIRSVRQVVDGVQSLLASQDAG